MIFKDRIQAANLLTAELEKYKGKNAIVLAIPRGGVPLGYVIAKELDLPLEVVLSKKIGHPNQKEFAIGAATLESKTLSAATADVSPSYIEEEIKKIRELLASRYEEYYGNKAPLQLKDKILIVVDDGIATGNTILSSIEMLHDEQPKKIVIVTPVSSPSAIQKLQDNPFIDEIICLSTPDNFSAVGQFYDNFEQVDDAEVKILLNKMV